MLYGFNSGVSKADEKYMTFYSKKWGPLASRGLLYSDYELLLGFLRDLLLFGFAKANCSDGPMSTDQESDTNDTRRHATSATEEVGRVAPGFY